MKRFLFLLAFLPSMAAAQVTVPAYRDAANQPQQGMGVMIVGQVTSTTTNGAIAVANTYQSALAANATRKGCTVYNNSAAAELVFLGAPGSATAATSIPLPAAGSFNCGSFQGTVLTDQISITSATAGATYVVVAQ